MTDSTTHSDAAPSGSSADGGVRYDPATETFHTRFDANSSTPVVAIVEAVATATKRDAISMSPLYATVDPDALTNLVTSARDPPAEVTFTYEGCRVTVSSCGTVVADPT
ncbi:HalOD1 output domain-containing protein [Salinilacihabitans rarus]|uniref:HalOD1 output domain-containing protein n=1 Tax=Salinilacihabitans rarus TaxID=2961596 RepID=UPI0020C88021|nr:HalOD1 output domain-containing protein [Salinilacihabitans rarus]